MPLRAIGLIALFLFCSGCVVRTAGSIVKTGADIGVGAAETGVKTTGAVVDAAIPDSQGHHDDAPRPFDEKRNASIDVDATLAAARASGKNALIILGGNWCHDSRGLAAKFERAELAAVIADHYELVWVDVGHRDRNLHIPRRFGVADLYGTPTVLILSPDGALLNRESVHDWKTADSKPYDETLDYFRHFAHDNP